MGVIAQLGAWRKRHHVTRQATIPFPDSNEVRLWELDNGEVGVIKKRAGGAFIDFHVENRPFGVVRGIIKRQAKKMQKGQQNGLV